MAKLVVITHPYLSNSIVNKIWISELEKYPNDFVLHDIYEQYPDLNFDLEREQQLLEKYDEIIFQFPFYWFSAPFAFKKYLDEVFAYGWAFGPDGDKLKGKKLSLAISMGGKQEAYEAGISVHDLLNDITLSFTYCGCKIGNSHFFYGAEHNPKMIDITQNATTYINTFLPQKEAS